MATSRKSNVKKAMHLVMRYTDDKYGVETIPAHREVADKKGGVMIAKVGKSLAEEKIRLFNEQIKAGVPTFLYLTKRTGPGEYLVHQAIMESVSRDLSVGDKHLVPDYYREHDVVRFADLWIKVSGLSPIKSGRFSKLTIASTGKNLVETLPRSVISLFMVRED